VNPTLHSLGVQAGQHFIRLDGLPPGAEPEVAEVTMIGAARPELLSAEFFAGRHRPQPGDVISVTAPPPLGATYVHVRGDGLDLFFLLSPASPEPFVARG
jgi:hypothetical protein